MEKDDVYRRLLTAAAPLPFGSDPFRDTGKLSPLTTGAVGHQCLSAVIPFGTRNNAPLLRTAFSLSPMPFGSDPFRDKRKESNLKKALKAVTNAFRQ